MNFEFDIIDFIAGSFSGLGFLSLYLSGKVRVFDCKGHVSKLCVVFLPLLIASLVGVSRVDDYWQHWQDVFAGALIGKLTLVIVFQNVFLIPAVEQSYFSFGELISICSLLVAGITMATFCYLQFFAPPYHTEGIIQTLF